LARPERTILAIGGGILALVGAAVIIVLVFGSPDPEEFPPDSPEGTVQRYLRAVHDGDADTARAMLSERAEREMPAESFERGYYCPSSTSTGRRVRIARVDRGEQRSTVYLSIQRTSGSGLSFNRSTYEQSVRLVREDGVWKIDDPWFCV
jgi:hypothetical protein